MGPNGKNLPAPFLRLRRYAFLLPCCYQSTPYQDTLWDVLHQQKSTTQTKTGYNTQERNEGQEDLTYC